MASGTLINGVIMPSNSYFPMGSLRPKNQKYNQTMDGSAPSPKFGLDPTQSIDPATKHTVSELLLVI